MGRRRRKAGSVHRRANGEGTIYPRKDGRWEAAYFTPDGKRHRLLRKTQDDARLALTAAVKVRDEGQVIPTGRGSVADLLKDWLPGMRQRIRYPTWRRYRELIECHIAPALGRISLARLSPIDVRRDGERDPRGRPEPDDCSPRAHRVEAGPPRCGCCRPRKSQCCPW